MNALWSFQYIIIPIVIVIYYIINIEKNEKSYQLVKSVWYFYYAIATFLNFIGEKSVTSDVIVGFTIALALYEGLPGFIKLTMWKIKALIGK